MKKFIATLFAAMLFVPTFAGCDTGAATGDAEVQEATGESALPEGTDEDAYMNQQNQSAQRPQN